MGNNNALGNYNGSLSLAVNGGTLDLNGNVNPTFAVLSGQRGHRQQRRRRETELRQLVGILHLRRDDPRRKFDRPGLYVGSGTLTLTGTSTYTGSTGVDSMLLLGPGGALGNTLVSVGATGTFGTALTANGGTSTLAGTPEPPRRFNVLEPGKRRAIQYRGLCRARVAIVAGQTYCVRPRPSTRPYDELAFGGSWPPVPARSIRTGIPREGRASPRGRYTLITAASGGLSGLVPVTMQAAR